MTNLLKVDHQRFLTRRATMAAMVSGAGLIGSSALAAECSIGPPAHTKGPVVWLDMDQVELDAAYDQSLYAPMADQIAERRAANSELIRKKFGAPLRISYGPTPVETFDFFKASKPRAPIFVFIHGGAWLRGEARNFSDSAELFLNAGANYVAIDFVAIKAANGDLRVMADQVRRAVAAVYRKTAELGADPDRFYIGGHSSGGHLCGVALVTDWAGEFGLPVDFIKGGLCMSGLYDMKPVRLSKRSEYIRFDDDMEQKMSSLRYLDRLRTPIIVSTGSFETPDFRRQSIDFAAAVKSAGKPVRLIDATGYNHYEMGESLGHPFGPNGRAVLEMMGLTG